MRFSEDRGDAPRSSKRSLALWRGAPQSWLLPLALTVILLVGAWLRLDAQNWDDFTHLHPDERFLTDVVGALGGPLRFTDGSLAEQEAHRARCEMRYPASGDGATWSEAGRGGYFDAECSPLNPNNVGKGLYVYGEFPLYTVHAAGVARSRLSADVHAFLQAYDPQRAAEHTVRNYWEGYSGVQLVGRTVSALADWLTIVVVFLLGRRLYGRWTGALAAAFYALAPFAIQQAHFWTVDAFTTFWVTLALYFAARALDGIGARAAPVPFFYALVWAGGTVWEAGYRDYPILGLLTLGALFALVYLGALAVRAWRGGRGDLWLAGSGALAAGLHLALWAALDALALRDFTLSGGMLALGVVSLVYGLAVLVAYGVARAVRQHGLGLQAVRQPSLAVGALGVMWIALAVGGALGGLTPWAALFVALSAVALLIVDVAELSDYALFGVALGGAVASRINVAPLAGIIVLVAALRALPALDRRLHRALRGRLTAYAMTGVVVAGLASFVVFRLLQPHAFAGPGIFGLKFNPGWREDIAEAAYLTSGNWDAPPNHQWASRTPYFFPWRNIVLWGMGIPLGLSAWIAWAAAGLAMLRARRGWTRHALLFAWVLVAFGWLGGRWVTTMRYFLPIYPALSVLAAWGLGAWVSAARRRAARPALRAAQSGFAALGALKAHGGAPQAALTAFVLLAAAWQGFAFHAIERHQLTRVAASRWFQEFVPGDLGIWVEGADGSRQMVNIGRGQIAAPPRVFHLEQGQSTEIGFMLTTDALLEGVRFNQLSDPARDTAPETVRVRLFHDDAALGRQLVFEATLQRDLNDPQNPYGQAYELQPAEPIPLPRGASGVDNYVLEVTASEGGPIMSIREMTTPFVGALNDVTVLLRATADGAPFTYDLNFDLQPILRGHGNDIPETPTHWTVGGADTIPFAAPIDGAIRTLEIPHLGDPLRDADAETVRFTLTAADGTQVSATLSADFAEGANPLGPPREVTFDEPLSVRRGEQVILTVEAFDPIYTSGPVIAWEGDWDDPVPWPTCALPDDVVYRDDLPSGLSTYDCAAMNMFIGYYQGLKLWMVAEDNAQKRDAMQNALDQADYVVITSNRFYDSLSRIPWRWPMTLRYYDALFDGRLGFELVRTFQAYPKLGPLALRDQILPTDDLPDWLNEHWEAEEAFHVYDHPTVFVFRKTAAYSAENTRAILEGVPLRPVGTALPGYAVDPDPVTIVPWGAKQASQAPTLLHFTDAQWAKQRAGGTWSALFDTGALLNRSQPLAVVVWWLLSVLVGWAIWPLLFVAFPALPDRGFPTAKIAAWVLIAWVAWVGGTLGLPTWERGGLALVTLAAVALSGAVAWRRRAELRAYLRHNRRHLLLTEALALVLYAVFIGVRLGNPDLWHNAFGGEKPMDFAYFNAVLRSSVFPPIDPWYAKGYINYYYFGYVIVGAPTKLLGIRPSLAYNLILPMLYSMTGMGVFSVAYNWARLRYARPGAVEHATVGCSRPNAARTSATAHDQPAADRSRRPRARRLRLPAGNPWVAGLAALMLAVVLGNLGALHVFATNVAKLGGYTQQPLYRQVRLSEAEAQRNTLYQRFYEEETERFQDKHGHAPSAPDEIAEITQSAQERTEAYIQNYAKHPPLYKLWAYEAGNLRKQIGAFFEGMGRLLGGAQLPMATHRWYWGPTRIISELPNGAGHGAIAEMPYFTFLYGDLHAHMIAFPVTLLVLLWALAEIAGAGYGLRRAWQAGLALFWGALAVGVLRPTNSWDWITYLLLALGTLTYAAWVRADATARVRGSSALAERLWALLRPSRAWRLLVVLWALPIGALGHVLFFAVQTLRAEQQAARGLKAGETLIAPHVSLGGALLWAVGALIVVVGVYLALLIAARARMTRPVLVDWLGRVVGFVVLSALVALPFTAYFATPYTAIKRWELETTPLWAYLYIHGLFIFIVITFLAWQSARWLRQVRVRELEGLAVPILGGGAALALIAVGGVVYGVREAAVAELVVPLLVWAGVLFVLPRQSPLLRAVYALIALALAISLGVEIVVLEGDIGRQNTVFKFYLQVWFMLSIAGGLALAWMLHSMARWHGALRMVWVGALSVLLALAAMYPLLATQARFLDRFNAEETPLTLDGIAYMKYATHGESDLWFSLRGDYEMIRWLQENVEGTPVVLEAHLFPSEYHWGARIAINTGMPTLLGWSFHQRQQRGLPDLSKLVQTHANNTAALYELSGAEGIAVARRLIDYYDIEYIVVGALERAFYGDIAYDETGGVQTAGHSPGLAKFEDMVALGDLEVVYAAPRCLIAVQDVADCPPSQSYVDTIYRVVR